MLVVQKTEQAENKGQNFKNVLALKYRIFTSKNVQKRKIIFYP